LASILQRCRRSMYVSSGTGRFSHLLSAIPTPLPYQPRSANVLADHLYQSIRHRPEVEMPVSNTETGPVAQVSRGLLLLQYWRRRELDSAGNRDVENLAIVPLGVALEHLTHFPVETIGIGVPGVLEVGVPILEDRNQHVLVLLAFELEHVAGNLAA